jgi:hypothetical protein
MCKLKTNTIGLGISGILISMGDPVTNPPQILRDNSTTLRLVSDLDFPLQK